MTSTAVVLTLIGDPGLATGVERAAAAAGLGVLSAASPTRKNWQAATAIVVDSDAARRCALAGTARRGGVILVVAGEPAPPDWSAAVDIGAHRLFALAAQEAELVRTLSELAEAGRAATRPGRLIAVTGGRGGSGASVFAAVLAQCADPSLLVDLDPYGGGIDLLLGAEAVPGLRWPDFGAPAGRLNWTAVRDALPQRKGVSILSSARCFHDIEPGPVAAIVEAGRRGGVTVVCDVPRQLNPPGAAVLEVADLVAVVTACDVRGIAAAAAVTGVLRTLNPNVGVVVRGPAPGGLTPGEAADLVAAPLLAAMRPEPALARRLEHGGLAVRRNSPLSAAARRVLAVLAPARAIRAA